MNSGADAYHALEIECEEFADIRASFHVLRVLLPLSVDREPIRLQLEQMIEQVAGDEWPGDGAGVQPDQPREPIGAAGAILVAELDSELSSFPRAGRTAEERFAASEHRYAWLEPRVPADSPHLVDFHARALMAKSRDPQLLDEAIAEYDDLASSALAAAGGSMTFMVSIYQMNLGALLTRRGSASDFDRADELMNGCYRWRESVFKETHPFTMVARGNMISTQLRRVEDREGRRPIAAARDIPRLRAAAKDATALYKQRKNLFGDRSSTVSLTLGYLARITLAIGDIRRATNFAQRSIAAMPDPAPSDDMLTAPMSEIVLAQCLLINLRIERDAARGRRLSEEEIEKRSRHETSTRARARALADHALPVIERSRMAPTWVKRANSLDLMEGPAASITNA